MLIKADIIDFLNFLFSYSYISLQPAKVNLDICHIKY